MKMNYGVIVFLVLFPAVFLAPNGKKEPQTSRINSNSCNECIGVNAAKCINSCVPRRGKACFSCLSTTAPQCLKPCGFDGPGQIESQGFGDDDSTSEQDCPTQQPTCPPSAGLRILSWYSRYASVATSYECEMWCSEDYECHAWTYDQRLHVCYLYDSAGCYDTTWERNWISGTPCRHLRSEYDAMDFTANSTSCIQRGILYSGTTIKTYFPILSAEACGIKCQTLGTVVQAWSWATEDVQDPLLRHRCFCKSSLGTPSVNAYYYSGDLDCPPSE